MKAEALEFGQATHLGWSGTHELRVKETQMLEFGEATQVGEDRKNC